MVRQLSGVFVGLLIFGALVVLPIVGMGDERAEVATEKSKEVIFSHSGDVILINNEGYERERKGPVEFTHKKHALDYKISCWDCHHDYKDGQNIWAPWGVTRKCSYCHDPAKKEVTNTKLQKAFHYNCKKCHRILAEKGQESGPYRHCNDCHKGNE